MDRKKSLVSLLLFVSFMFLTIEKADGLSGTQYGKKAPLTSPYSQDYQYTYNFLIKKYEQIKVENIWAGDKVSVYSEVDGFYSDEDFMQRIGKRVEEDIIPVLENFFAEIIYDRIDIVFYDIKDFYSIGGQEYFAGYFDPDYTYNNNKIFIDVNPGMIYSNIEDVLAVIAHELQHLIHYSFDENEEKWINEGLSELSTYVCGFENKVHTEEFIKFPFRTLDTWTGDLNDYGKVYLFFRYLMYRKGTEIINSLIHDKNNGIESLYTILGKNQFKQIHHDWACALSINNEKNIRYSITGYNFTVEPVLYLDSGRQQLIDINMEKTSFYKLEGYTHHLQNSPIKLNIAEQNIMTTIFLYNNNNLNEIYEIKDQTTIFPQMPYNRYITVISNPATEDTNFSLELNIIGPEFRFLKNPYYDENRLIGIKGKTSNIKINNTRNFNYTKEIDQNTTVISCDLNLTKQNTIEYSYYLTDKEYKGTIILKQGEI